jgi:NAD(P)-dependent dehydrogenase (short-subunit alcohol dehydrogenase family)
LHDQLASTFAIHRKQTIGHLRPIMAELSSAKDKTVIVTGAANGIGAETARLFHQNGANIVVADLPSSESAAKQLISELSNERAIYIPTNILVWKDMTTLFSTAEERFGRIDIVVANAGLMESEHLFDLAVDSDGSPKEPAEHHRVIDVNVKGTMNTLTMAMHYMKQQEPLPNSQTRGSVVLIASTSGYFGGTGVMAYVASKHGVVGLLRASQKVAGKNSVRVNAVAPYFTPTHMTGEFSSKWLEAGLPANTALDVATAVATTALDESLAGSTILVSKGVELNVLH